MKNKTVLSFLIFVLSLIIIFVVTLASIETNYEINLPRPSSITIFDNSQTSAVVIDKDNVYFETIMKLYDESTKKSVLSQITNGELLSFECIEDPEADAWSEYNKNNGIFIEFMFDTPKAYILTNNKNNTRRINISAIIFEVTKYADYQKVLVYYKEGTTYLTKNTDNSIFRPIAIEAKTDDLYNYIKDNVL